MAAPKQRPIVPITPQKGSGAGWVVAMVLATGGFFAWKYSGAQPSSKKSAEHRSSRTVAATPFAATPMPRVITPERHAEPVAVAKPAEPTISVPEVNPAITATPGSPDTYAELLVLDAVAGKRAENIQRRDQALKQTIADGKWDAYLDLLNRSMAAELKETFKFDQPQAYDRYVGNPIFYTALLQSVFIANLPSDARAILSKQGAERDFYAWLMTTPEAMEDWLLTVQPEDNAVNVLKNWAFLQVESPEARDKYRALALACSVVFDKEFKPKWNDETLAISASLRYNSYKVWDERGELETHLTRMSAQDLKWVINAPVPDSELEWARKNVRLKQRDWGNAYGMVPYDMDKAVTGKQKKPYDSYTFAEIREKGGICGDQTYFAANTARALGIPAAEISGDGPMGGHAWVRWKADPYTWKESGRIGGYGAGRTTDPQTGKTVSELEFARRSDRRANSENLTTRAFRFIWLAQLHDALGETARSDAAVGFAVATNRSNSELWEAKLTHWSRKRREAPVDEWKKFLDSWKHEFAEDAELVAQARKAEEQFIYPRLDSKSVMREMRSDARELERRREGTPPTADEIAVLYQRQAQALAKDKDYAGIRAVYHRAFREHGDDTAAFKKLARDYFALAREDADAKVDAAREIEASFERFLESKDNNWFVTQSQNSALGIVADCWKQAGQPDRAERMEKEMERRTKRAKREAL